MTHALVTRLREAGYTPIESGAYDLSVGTWYAMRWDRGEDPAFAKARIRPKDRKGGVVDDVSLEFRGQTAPISEPDRVAVSLVNHVARSKTIVRFATIRSRSTKEPCLASDEGEPLP